MKLLKSLFLFVFFNLSAQQKLVETIYFDFDKFDLTKLTYNSKKELDKIASILLEKKSVQFEIRGHVCCTPEVYTDGIDKETGERRLSWFKI